MGFASWMSGVAVVIGTAPMDLYRCGFVENSVALLEALCHWGVSFEVSEGHARPSVSLCPGIRM